MSFTDILTAQVFREPRCVHALDGAGWTELIGQAGAAGMLARIAARLREATQWDAIPEGPRRHLRSAEVLVTRQQAQARFEISAIGRALANLDCPVVLLKGAAYVALENSAARGRLLSDIDVMVPRAKIGAAESALMMGGWVSAEHDAYNQRYYREWMHEIPPMHHIQRGTVVDLHHTIVPPTACPGLDADRLFASAVPLPGFPGLSVLAAEDRVIHAAAHLFHDGDLARGLRDLSDIAGLIHEGRVEVPGFAELLVTRAKALGLVDELTYALFYVKLLFGLPLDIGAPGVALQFAFERALMPEHPSCEDRWSPLARLLVYVRSHWLRMPLYLLLPHLTKKLAMRVRGSTSGESAQVAP